MNSLLKPPSSSLKSNSKGTPAWQWEVDFISTMCSIHPSPGALSLVIWYPRKILYPRASARCWYFRLAKAASEGGFGGWWMTCLHCLLSCTLFALTGRCELGFIQMHNWSMVGAWWRRGREGGIESFWSPSSAKSSRSVFVVGALKENC